MAVTQEEQMLINELRKYERVLAKEGHRANNLLARSKKLGAAPYLNVRPKAYQLNFSFEPGDFTAITQTLSISEGKKFACHAISSSFSVVGQATVDTNPGGAPVYGPGQIANITAGYSSEGGEGPSNRQRFFDFFWRIRDASGDNDFQDIEQPSVMLCSGHDAPLNLPVPWFISAGSLVEMDILPFISTTLFTGGTDIEGISNVRAYNLIVKLWGEEYI